MRYSHCCLVAAILALLLGCAAAGGVTHDTGDRMMDAMGASADAINEMMTNKQKRQSGARAGLAFAKLTTNRAADPYMFGGNRRLLSHPTTSTGDRISASMSAMHATLLDAVESGSSTRDATAKGMTAARMATNRAANIGQFGDRRKLQGGATTDAGDRITTALGATQDAIDMTASALKSNARAATSKGLGVAKMTTNRAADLWQFSGNNP